MFFYFYFFTFTIIQSITTSEMCYIYIYIYAFSRLLSKATYSAFRLYICIVSMCVPWESNPQPLRC